MARSKKKILLSQRKYVLDLLSDAGMLKCRRIDFSMDVIQSSYQIRGGFLRMLSDT